MKKFGYILLVIVLLFIINGLVHSIYDLWQKQNILTSAQKQLDVERLKNSKLKGELTYVQSQQFVDETARNKLFLAKPGEQQILLPDGSVSNQILKAKENLPNWQQWLKLFF
jgi:cell division protein FtsB